MSSWGRIGILASLLGAAAGCSNTSYVLVGTRRAPIPPSEVKVYLTPPATYEEIAILSSDSKNAFAFSDQQRMDLAIGRLKAEAASVGANGILFQGAENQYTGSVGVSSVSFHRRSVIGLAGDMPLYVKAARGVGIYVEPDLSSAISALPLADTAQASAALARTQRIDEPAPAASTQSTQKRNVGATFGPSSDGLGVVSVEKNGVAARAGLKLGDVITEIDGHETAPLYWKYAAERLTNGGDTVTIEVRGRGERSLSFAE